MSITIPQKALIPKQDLYSLDIRSAVSGLKGLGNPWPRVAGILDQVQSSSNRLEKAIRDVSDSVFNEIIIRDASGNLIGWIGSRGGYSGAWFKQLYVGGDGPDTAPFFADVDGNVIIGKNGSLELQDGGGNEVGWLGVQEEASQAITDATNTTPIVIEIVAHGYEDGDTVFIENVGGNTAANGYRIVQNSTVDDFEITDLDGVDVAGSGAYTSGGTASRYFGGGRFQTLAVGDSFTDYKIRAYADGQVKIKDALITLTDAANNGYIELNPSTGPNAIFRDTFIGQQIQILAGVLYGNNSSGTAESTELSLLGLTVRNSSGNANVSVFTTGGGSGTGAIYVRNSSGTEKVTLTASSGNGLVSIYNSGGSNVISLAGSTGTMSGTNADVSNEYLVGGVAVIDSARVVNGSGYEVGGTPGVTASHNVVTNVTASTASAVDSVDFGASTTTSITVVTGISLTTVSRAWTSGLLTT